MIDNINPDYYRKGKIEITDFIIDQKLNFLEGNIIKYICRYKHKGKSEDLRKAEWYIKKLMKDD